MLILPILPRLFYPAALALLLGACAAPVRQPAAEGGRVEHAVPVAWSGRLGVTVERDFSEQNQSLHAHFTLTGDATAGRLDVFSPVGGAQLAALRWTAAGAALEHGGQIEHAASVDVLAARLLGADLPPLATVLDWLAGRATTAAGWSIDFDNRTAGRVRAERARIGETVRLRILAQPVEEAATGAHAETASGYNLAQ